MQNHQNPPRPPPLSVSQPVNHPKPKPNSHSSLDESPDSPLRSEDHELDHPKNGGANFPVEKYYSPLASPLPITPPKDAATPGNFSSHPHQIINFNQREEEAAQSHVVLGDAGGERKGRVGVGGGERKERGGSVGGERVAGKEPMRWRREDVVEKINVGLRALEIVFCLISFSVMASDKTQGWSGDSFDRYKEYRFCFSVNILGFVYSAFQAYDVANHLATGKHVITHHLRYQLEFVMDQIIAYLLISASSAAASRVDDWQANWGKDTFTERASASVSMAFLAFLGFAMSSLISGYNLCNRDLS